jgi:hypothetical protein
MMPFAGRVTASLQAARRLFTGDGRLEDEPPDNQENMTTVPVAAVKICNSSAAHDEPKEEKRKLRRDIEDAAAQIDLMTAVHDTLQAQVNSAAVTTLRTARAAADDDDSKHKKHDQQHTGSPTDDQQQNSTVQQQDLQDQQQAQHIGSPTDDQQQYEGYEPKAGDHQQSEQGTAGDQRDVSEFLQHREQQQDLQDQQQDDQQQLQQQYEADDEDDWAWTDSDDEDDARCTATLQALHRMDFSVMDAHRDAEQHKQQHDSCTLQLRILNFGVAEESGFSNN